MTHVDVSVVHQLSCAAFGDGDPISMRPLFLQNGRDIFHSGVPGRHSVGQLEQNAVAYHQLTGQIPGALVGEIEGR